MQDSPNFAIRQSLASPDTVNGTIVLTKELDFEKQSMYTLTVFAMVGERDYTGVKLCSLSAHKRWAKSRYTVVYSIVLMVLLRN